MQHDWRQRIAPWVFPTVLISLLATLTLLKVSGTSVGAFYTYLYGTSNTRPELIANKPREIRSDEWELNTPLTIAQAEAGFPRVNPNIGDGQDMSVVLDVPYKEWSTIFKPQNWVFFIVPLEYAFAFKWWFLGAALMLAAYFFTLTVLPKRYGLASLLALILFFSPFIQWWYTSGTVLAIAYGILIVTLTMQLLEQSRVSYRSWLIAGALAYCLTALVLLLYLPFVMAISLVVIVFLLGHLANQLDRKKSDYLKANLALVAAAAVVAATLCLAFLADHRAAITAIRETVYPGDRVELNGGFPLTHFASGFFNGQLQSTTLAAHFPINQSEASNFVLVFLFLLPAVTFFQLRQLKQKKETDYRLLGLGLLTVLLLARLFMPGLDWLAGITQVDRIPHTRLLIAFGLLNIVGLVLCARSLETNWRPSARVVTASALGAAAATLAIGFLTRHQFPGFLESTIIIAGVTLGMGAVVYCLLTKRFAVGLALLAAFSFASTYAVNPLYRGLSPIVGSELSRAIKETGDSLGRWVVSEDVIFENVVPAAGVRSLTGVYSYPQLELWSDLKRSEADEDIYNRFAHVFFTIEAVDRAQYPIGAYLDPPATDAFRVHADPCSDFLARREVRYILTSNEKAGFPCLTELKKVEYPMRTFRIYQIN